MSELAAHPVDGTCPRLGVRQSVPFRGADRAL